MKEKNPYFPYFNEFHKTSSEASQKEVERMQQHPLSREEVLKQVEMFKNHRMKEMTDKKQKQK